MPDKFRVQFDFTPDALKTLDMTRDKLSLSSRAEVIRYALKTLQWVLEQLQSGAKILVEKDGKAQEVVFPFLKVREEVTTGAGAAEEVTRFRVGSSQ
jgi:hypothetical protein